jgi:multiple sugar transport system substrate-binding protein
MTIRLDRRQFLMGSSALAAAGALGLTPAFAQSAGLRQFFWGGQARADRTYGVNDLFKAANGAEVDSSFLGWGDYWPKLATETAGGNSPDIVQMDYRFIVEYAKRGAIAPLDEYVGGSLKLDGFDADQLEGGKVDGKLYGISLGANSVAQLVNVSAFEEAGIEQPNRDTTYDDIRAMGEAFLSKNIRGGIRVIADGSGSEPMLDNWLRQKGLDLYTADGNSGTRQQRSARKHHGGSGQGGDDAVELQPARGLPGADDRQGHHHQLSPYCSWRWRWSLPQAIHVLLHRRFVQEQGTGG